MSFLNPVAGIVEAVTGLAGAVIGNREKKEANIHDETIASVDQFAAEFIARAQRTKWDSFVDGLNRLPRPLMALSVLGTLVWAAVDPISFSARMVALTLVPLWFAAILAQIITFFFGGRVIEKSFELKGPSASEVASAVLQMKEIQKMKVEEVKLSEAEYQRQIKDEEIPLSNEAILEWNRRNGRG